MIPVALQQDTDTDTAGDTATKYSTFSYIYTGTVSHNFYITSAPLCIICMIRTYRPYRMISYDTRLPVVIIPYRTDLFGQEVAVLLGDGEQHVQPFHPIIGLGRGVGDDIDAPHVLHALNVKVPHAGLLFGLSLTLAFRCSTGCSRKRPTISLGHSGSRAILPFYRTNTRGRGVTP